MTAAQRTADELRGMYATAAHAQHTTRRDAWCAACRASLLASLRTMTEEAAS